jgi:hypothetical protein
VITVKRLLPAGSWDRLSVLIPVAFNDEMMGIASLHPSYALTSGDFGFGPLADAIAEIRLQSVHPRWRIPDHARPGASRPSTDISGASSRAAARASWSVVKIRVSPIAAVIWCRSISDRRYALTRAKMT